MPFNAYYKEINKNLRSGSTERSYYAGFQNLLQALSSKVNVFTEHGKIDVGHPDFEARLKQKAADFPIGWIEAKNPGEDLKKIERTDQLKRYLGLHNLILTDFIEFRWYRDGKQDLKARLGTIQRKRLKVDPKGESAVRELLEQFLATEFAAPRTPGELAKRMAGLAHVIHDITLNTYNSEKKSGELHAQYEAFKETLIPDLEPDEFADMYAQTITYGLFAAACQPRKQGEKFSVEKAAYLIPKTNPFLRKLFGHIAGPDLDDRIRPFVKHLVSLLAKADLGEILKDFGKRTGKEDPVVHFYEDFLQKYDPKVREMRGVYYTPEPVVQYIVRSIDHLLKTKFNKPDGLADKNVLILDPACGTGTFLYYVIRHIHSVIVHKKKQKGRWNTYVSQNLLKRVFGFELLMAPYAVAHLKLGLLLKELGYKFDTDERLGIFLTNTLQEAVKKSEAMFAQFIADEANAAADIKREKPIMVVLGNPPYSGISANKGQWIDKLLKGKLPSGEGAASYYEVDGKPLGEKKVWLQDDYVKFLRFAQWRIHKTGHGILGFITNHGYLDNPTFRGMRQQLLNEFTDIHILDLHGNTKKKERAPDGGKDENVFDIQQGVSIGLFVKEADKNVRPTKKIGKLADKRKMDGGADMPVCDPAAGQAHHAELWGLRDIRKKKGPESLRIGGKYHFLEENDISTTKWKKLEPNSPYYFFLPRDDSFKDEYLKYLKITDVLKINTSGIVTARDSFVTDIEKDTLLSRIKDLRSEQLSDGEIRAKYFHGKGSSKYPPGDTRGWKLPSGREKIRSDAKWKKRVQSILYRPFDWRHIYNTPWMVDWPRPEVMTHMHNGGNIALCTNKEVVNDFRHVLCTNSLITDCTVSLATRERTYLFPLYKYENETSQIKKQLELTLDEVSSSRISGNRISNLNAGFVQQLVQLLKLNFLSDGTGDLKKTFGPEDVFHYIYAVFHSPIYRKRYTEFLKSDFPRVPLTSDKKLFCELCKLGCELVSLHLMESPKLSDYLTAWPESGDNVVERPRYEDNHKRVYINKTQCFEGVPKEVWEFHIGGYQVCEKWLKDRKGRKLSDDDLDHYQKIVVALNETIRLMQEIDEAIPAWPIK